MNTLWRWDCIPFNRAEIDFLKLGIAVDGGHRAVIFDRFRGVLDKTAGEGTHFIIPWIQTPYIFDVRTRPRSITSVTGTKGMGSC